MRTSSPSVSAVIAANAIGTRRAAFLALAGSAGRVAPRLLVALVFRSMEQTHHVAVRWRPALHACARTDLATMPLPHMTALAHAALLALSLAVFRPPTPLAPTRCMCSRRRQPHERVSPARSDRAEVTSPPPHEHEHIHCGPYEAGEASRVTVSRPKR